MWEGMFFGSKIMFSEIFWYLDPVFELIKTHYHTFVLSKKETVSHFVTVMNLVTSDTQKKSGHLFLDGTPMFFSTGRVVRRYEIYLHLPGLFYGIYVVNIPRYDILHFSCWRIMLWFYQWLTPSFQPTLSRLGETAIMKIQFIEIPPLNPSL